MRTDILLAFMAPIARAFWLSRPLQRRHSSLGHGKNVHPEAMQPQLTGSATSADLPIGSELPDFEVIEHARIKKLDAETEERAKNFWSSCGIKSKSRLSSLAKFGRRAPSRYFDVAFLQQRLEKIAEATQLGSIEEAADLVSRAPSLLGNRPETLAKKIALLESYFDDIDIIRMVWKQPTLLARDVENTIVRNIMSLEEIFGDTTARLVEWQPHIMFIQHEVLKEHVEKLIELFIGTGAFGKANDNSRAEAIFILSRAPSLLVYRFDTVQSALEAWANLLPGTTLCKVWSKFPTILQADVDNTILPKINILQEILLNPNDDIFVSPVTALVEKNPSFLAYSREKYTRLQYQYTFSHIDAPEIRRTLMLDTSLGEWLERTGVQESDYAAWLRGRLQRSEISIKNDDLSSLEKANGAALAQIGLTEARESFDADQG